MAHIRTHELERLSTRYELVLDDDAGNYRGDGTKAVDQEFIQAMSDWLPGLLIREFWLHGPLPGSAVGKTGTITLPNGDTWRVAVQTTTRLVNSA